MTDLLELLAIANRAADVARDLFATTRPGRLTEKTDRDYATELDYAVERKLREFLNDRTPDIGFLGEEEGGVDPKDGRTYWALDPVDGTANLIHGLPLCGVSLGLIHAGQPDPRRHRPPVARRTIHCRRRTRQPAEPRADPRQQDERTQ